MGLISEADVQKLRINVRFREAMQRISGFARGP
jgi:hypothetical protein